MAHRHPGPRALRATAMPLQKLLTVTLFSLGALGATSLLLPELARAQPAAAAAQRYAIAAGPLDEVLLAFGQRAGVMVGTDPALTAGVRSPGLQGAYGQADGLAALLAGTGLQAVPAQGGGYRLRRAPSGAPGVATLDPVRVTGQHESAFGAVEGYVATRSASGSKTDTPLLETPQSISVIGAQQIADQAAQSVAATLRYTPGVRGDSFGVSTDRDYVRVRGFMPNFYQDGMMLPYGLGGQGAQSDPYGLERVEVLRGPSSVLYGQNPPGGIVNMVSKRPTDTAQHEIQLQGGSFDRAQAAMDFSGPIDQEGKWLYRFVALQRDSGTQVDGADDNRTYVAPSLTWRPSANTSLTLLAQYQKDDSGIATQYYPAYGTLYSNPNGRIDSNMNVGEPDRDKLNREFWSAGYIFEHAFSDQLSFKQSARYARVKSHNFSVWGNGFATNPATGLPSDYRTLLRRASDINRTMVAAGVDNQLVGKFATGDFQHTVLAGFDFRRETIDNYNGSIATNSLDLLNPVYGKPIGAITYTADNYQTLNQYGLYLQDQIKIDHVVVTLSGRQDWSRSALNNRRTNADTRAQDQAFTGRMGLTYLFDNGVAPYVSYSTSFEPLLGTMSPARGSAPLAPTKGEQTEIGIKYQPVNMDALFSVAWFDMKQRNVQTPDPDNILYSVQTGKVGSQGLELEARAAITPELQVIANYTFTNATVLETNNPAQLHKQLPLIPRHQASLWGTYKLGRYVPGLEVGAGVRYTGSTYGDTANAWRTDGYTVFDAMVQYDLGVLSPTLKGASVALNVQNIGDKEYLTGCQSAGSCEFGERRTVLATVKYRW